MIFRGSLSSLSTISKTVRQNGNVSTFPHTALMVSLMIRYNVSTYPHAALMVSLMIRYNVSTYPHGIINDKVFGIYKHS